MTARGRAASPPRNPPAPSTAAAYRVGLLPGQELRHIGNQRYAHYLDREVMSSSVSPLLSFRTSVSVGLLTVACCNVPCQDDVGLIALSSLVDGRSGLIKNTA
jgi:hypothetical protein